MRYFHRFPHFRHASGPLARIPFLVQSAVALLLFAGQSATLAAQDGAIRGRVAISGQRDFTQTEVELVGLARRTSPDSVGRFYFGHVPAGVHALVLRGAAGDVAAGVAPLASVRVRVMPGVVTDVVLGTGRGVASAEPSARELAAVVVRASRPLHVIGHLPDVQDGVIYSGKKTELIVMDSLHANLAQDVERQILGRIPGAHFSETEGAGFPSNGVGFRGLDPTQSVEVNTRQNGVNLAADVFGYPETYYTPPSEALERIEVVRGSGSLAFGPQFGGMINYVTRRGALNTATVVQSHQTVGSYGLFNSFNAVGGGGERLTFYAFMHGRRSDGWRPNSDLRQATAFASAAYKVTDRLQLAADVTMSRNRIHMAGGLSDEQFAADPSQSLRARNWLANPWNIVSMRAAYVLSRASSVETTLSFQNSDRHLIWRNEDGGAAALDVSDAMTGEPVPREVERETFSNMTVESRLRVEHALFDVPQTLAMGLRASRGWMRRFEGGPGTSGSDFDMTLVGGTWERDLSFTTNNAALFAENLLRFGRLTLTPGARVEFIRSTASGYTENATTFDPRTLRFPLFGMGAELALTSSTAVYANVSQAYRPILNSALTPFGSVARVAADLHAARGYNAEVGWRGNAGGALKFDLGVFQLGYRDRIGTRTIHERGKDVLETANVGSSVHRGVEGYLELDPFALAGMGAPQRERWGDIGLFTSFAYVDARYRTGEFAGRAVEQAPRNVDRVGLSYSRRTLGMTLQASHTGRSFGDANNTVRSTAEDGAVGLVPAYTVLDWSGNARLTSGVSMSVGVNNLADSRYFTKRTGEYPGPGILPGLARSVYASLGSRF